MNRFALVLFAFVGIAQLPNADAKNVFSNIQCAPQPATSSSADLFSGYIVADESEIQQSANGGFKIIGHEITINETVVGDIKCKVVERQGDDSNALMVAAELPTLHLNCSENSVVKTYDSLDQLMADLRDKLVYLTPDSYSTVPTGYVSNPSCLLTSLKP